MRRPYLLIGTCQRAHGVKGEVLVRSLTDDNTRFYEGLVCHVMDGAGEQPVEQLTLAGCRPTPQGLLLAFKGIHTRELARRLTGTSLAVERDDALALKDEYEFYSGDLIGTEVVDARRGFLGRVTDILNAGSGAVLIVSNQSEKDVLVPFLRSIVQAINPELTRIDVTLPEGLYELYRHHPDGLGKE